MKRGYFLVRGLGSSLVSDMKIEEIGSHFVVNGHFQLPNKRVIVAIAFTEMEAVEALERIETLQIKD